MGHVAKNYDAHKKSYRNNRNSFRYNEVVVSLLVMVRLKIAISKILQEKENASRVNTGISVIKSKARHMLNRESLWNRYFWAPHMWTMVFPSVFFQ